MLQFYFSIVYSMVVHLIVVGLIVVGFPSGTVRPRSDRVIVHLSGAMMGKDFPLADCFSHIEWHPVGVSYAKNSLGVHHKRPTSSGLSLSWEDVILWRQKI